MVYLVRHNKTGKFMHRKYKSSGARHWGIYYRLEKKLNRKITRNRYLRDQFTPEEKRDEIYSADTAVDAATFANIGGLKNSVGHWNQSLKKNVLPPDITVYCLHPCIEGKIQLTKVEIEY